MPTQIYKKPRKHEDGIQRRVAEEVECVQAEAERQHAIEAYPEIEEIEEAAEQTIEEIDLVLASCTSYLAA